MHKHELERIKAEYIRQIIQIITPYLNTNKRVHFKPQKIDLTCSLIPDSVVIYGATPESLYINTFEALWEHIPVELLAEVYANIKSWIELHEMEE